MRVSGHCYAVTGLGYSPPWCVNAGFVVGREITLVVDTGANALAAASIYGYALAVKPSNRLLVVNTEKHFDHIGGNSFFREKGVEIWAHAKLYRTQEEFRSEIQEFNDRIMNPVRRAAWEAKAFFSGTKLALPDRYLDADERLHLGDCEARLILTPGHTETNLSVWIAEDQVLFSGDCLTNEYLPNLDASIPQDWPLWLHSLDRIESLHPRILLPGHGPVARAEQVQHILQTVRNTLQRAIATGHSPTLAQ